MDRIIVCTVCPLSCHVRVTLDEHHEITAITEASCKRGETYAAAECTNPQRTLTTTVRIEGGIHAMLPVRTDRPIPKELMRLAMAETGRLVVKSPICLGDIVIEDILGTGANLVATRDL